MSLRLGAPDRRRGNRGAPHGEPRRKELVSLILGNYLEMPGLSLTSPQAARLFALHRTTCDVVLRDLVVAGRLRRDWNGRYSLP